METSFVLSKELRTPTGSPINVLLFSDDARFLLSGGDDEKVRVWNTDDHRCIQILENDNWGQVTCMTWVYQDLPTRERTVALCVGSARGYVTIFPMEPRKTKPFSKMSRTMPIFPFNDPVEQQAFDKLNRRLALASHSGELKLYTVDNCLLKLLWAGEIGVAIPSALFFFGGANQSLLALGLENSELSCRDATRNTLMWRKEYIGGAGSAALSSDETTLLVNNLTTGNFDVYQVPDDAPLRSLPMGSTRRYTKQCQFFEGTKLAVCGSDINKVFLVDVSNNYIVQTLTGGDEAYMTQTIGVTQASSRKVFIAGANGGSIYLWEKRAARREPEPQTTAALPPPPPPANANVNVRAPVIAALGTIDMLALQLPTFALALVLTYPSWVPQIQMWFDYLKDRLPWSGPPSFGPPTLETFIREYERRVNNQ